MLRKVLRHTLQAPCPCGLAASYADCCHRYHQAEADTAASAPTPEALMRSRYSAYVLGDVGYLLATWHPSTAPGELELSPTHWQSLEVLASEARGDVGAVEFIARYKVSGKAHKLHELSRFVREQGRWLYIDGQFPDEAA